MTQDHVIGGGAATILTTNLPPVLAAAHWFGPGAPVDNETALLLAAGYLIYTAVHWLVTRPRALAETKSAAKAATPAAAPAQPAPQATEVQHAA